MPKRFADPVVIPSAVLDGLETVRESGETNAMADQQAVQAIAARLGYPETVEWIEYHPREYTEGVFRFASWCSSRRR
jgi:hypothetical protein